MFVQFFSKTHPSHSIYFQASPQGNQRVDELPVVQTKAKINQALLRGSTNDFGMDSMFESTRSVAAGETDFEFSQIKVLVQSTTTTLGR